MTFDESWNFEKFYSKFLNFLNNFKSCKSQTFWKFSSVQFIVQLISHVAMLKLPSFPSDLESLKTTLTRKELLKALDKKAKIF